MGTKGTARSNPPGREPSRFGFGPSRLAAFATRRPRRVLAVWGLLVLVSLGLVSGLLDSGLTPDGTLTNNPESLQAKDLIDARLPNRNKVDEVIVVRSESAVVSDPAFSQQVRSLVRDARATGAVRSIQTYLDGGGKELVSADRHATMVPLVLAEEKDKRVKDLTPVIEKADGGNGFAVTVTGKYTL